MTSYIITVKEIKGVFEDWTKDYGVVLDKERNFEDFLKYLEIDFWDWVRENLRCYFRER